MNFIFISLTFFQESNQNNPIFSNAGNSSPLRIFLMARSISYIMLSVLCVCGISIGRTGVHGASKLVADDTVQ